MLAPAAVVLAAVMPGSGAEAPAPGIGAPRIAFASREHDFGRKDAGPDLSATFEFKNVGTGVLTIQDVSGG
jgi:hypothetical protein